MNTLDKNTHDRTKNYVDGKINEVGTNIDLEGVTNIFTVSGAYYARVDPSAPEVYLNVDLTIGGEDFIADQVWFYTTPYACDNGIHSYRFSDSKVDGGWWPSPYGSHYTLEFYNKEGRELFSVRFNNKAEYLRFIQAVKKEYPDLIYIPYEDKIK
ncbi:MAG: hypothetical protein IPM74_01195 [Crocinitomicaceae bacterium]|nr:hypothetical protein [Crocinitomicaceae bacterium]MBK8924533.1 hypothetical protein [Crocinitomicaceae bacterium]